MTIPGFVNGDCIAGNLKMSGNTLSSTDTNGDLNLKPDGTGDVVTSKSDVGGTVTYKVENKDNTNTSSHSRLRLGSQPSGGDPYLSWEIAGAQAYAMGIDNTASDILQITNNGSGPSSGTVLWSLTHGQNATIGSSNVGATTRLRVSNTDNTNASSIAEIQALVGGSSAGDPFMKWTVSGVLEYSMGIDNDDSDKLTITDGSSPSTGTALWEMTSAGERTMPLQPAFLASLTSTDDNETGDGTSFVLGDTDVGTALTEIFDQNGDFTSGASGGAFFTAPITGRYRFDACIILDDVTSAHNILQISLVTNNRTITGTQATGAPDANGRQDLQVSMLVDMDETDTAKIAIAASGSTKTIDIFGSTSRTFWSGCLVC